ncbi:MAG: 3-deoxy-7-phosphoheptulonate synthase [Planctomycetota bacterium]
MNTTPHHSETTATTARPTQNLNVASLDPLTAPAELERELPLTDAARRTVIEGRKTIEAILRGEDRRLLVVIGPCSIHDPKAAMEYARKLAELKQELDDRIFLVMRVYFEKPRTTVGWKGLINDPHLDGSFDMAHGLKIARKLLIDINELGLPAGTEFLDPVTPQYLDDLVSWAAIGARTTESQTHRQMASGLSMPVGFKNATNGSLQVALDAMQSALNPHHFIGVDDDGRACVVHTRGNAYGHVILRGGEQGSNYHPQDIAHAAAGLKAAGMNPLLMVDCSHANSGKKFAQQEVVWDSLIQQRVEASDANSGEAITGVMIESNLFEGKQSIPQDLSTLRYGVSVTDECIGWDTTAAMLRRGYDRLIPATG